MSTPDSTSAAEEPSVPDNCCAPGDKCAALVPTTRAAAKGGTRFRVPTADCAAEESEIRRAVMDIRGIKGLAVFADMGASLLVVGNGLRLLRKAGSGK